MNLMKWGVQPRRRASTAALTTAYVVGLSACGHGDISKLKAQTLDANSSYTIGQAFDHRNVCNAVSWKESTDNRGRKVIEYRCVFNIDRADSENAQRQQIDKLRQGMQAEQKGIQLQIEQMGHSLDIQGKSLEESVASPPVEPALLMSLEQQQKDHDAAVAKYQQMKANGPQTMADIQKKYEDLIARAKSEGIVAGATETFQWTVNDDGFTPIYAGRDIEMSNGNVVHQNYSEMNAEHAVAAMIRNDAANLQAYILQVPWPY
ncbi:hypothetical protein [Dyella caseinilytica]|uniref:Uncharacterized protein n=1 Tax=Dyella caseinilytica TaxID=1849581 RepID=A0ABX7GSW5_9GAMM|nr:hypothetical protein [Dyella caseinilytica]QRN53543.1 hypothetical protein ISN74_19375 [Dyella caseinilytica]GFZ87191.1 hypothetical protein GCM10011408_02340 [Dyella caseinilytica]